LYALGRDRQASGHKNWAPGGEVARHLQIAMGWRNNLTLFSHACVSAHLAIQQARNLLEQDLADKVLLVSFDYIGPFVTGGFHALKILNSGMPAPYGDRETGSIGLGDGAAWAVLSKKPGSWKIRGSETWNEMYHFTANDPSGDGFKAVVQPMLSGLQQCKLWVKGHGTGTLDTGKLESGVIQQLFPASPLVSWKGSLGHTLGSCALVEAILAMHSHDTGTIPGTVGTDRPTFTDSVATTPFAAKDFDSILLLANAFGGAHAALWLSHD
jgi:3-oxoacyl-(acyl-carrier-protein) synthase